MHEQICDVGHGIFVSGRSGCDESRLAFDQVIHIHHPGGRDPAGTCDAIRAKACHTIEYTDGEPLPLATIEHVAGVGELGGKLLVHCAFGQCRGPTLAVVAKVARGVVPWHAMHDITVALWLQRRIAPHWCPLPLAAIFG